MKKLLSLTLILIFTAGFLASCNKDKGDPPVLPPQETMTIDFSNFASQKKSADLIYDQKGTNNSNWDFAAKRAGDWRTIIVNTLAVPVASFILAIDRTPVYLEEKTWQWSFSITVSPATYKARLTGLIRASDVLWKMYITNEATDGFSEFLWFEGTSSLDGTGGQWTLNHSSTYKEPLLQIAWTKSGTTIGTVKYTYVRTLNDNRVADPFNTSSIEYGLTTGSYDAYYIIHYNNPLFSDVNVEWNTTAHIGRVKCVDYLGDTNWYSWDGNKNNI
ncbi:MAG: hypothetical protein NT144_02985 [Bacteroidia bacterium]|nr:hypothetical protein [Bacteroidia bacterium]